MRNPEDVRRDLLQLIQDAQHISPRLASRLDEMRRWIAQKKSGFLMRKKYVMQLLEELIADVSFWLNIQLLTEAERNTELAQLSPVERYWYEYLFPTWFNEKDPKLNLWKKNLMAENFSRSDAAFVNLICSEIEFYGGYTLNPYIADLSMATDLITCSTKELSLCVQLTTLREKLSDEKQHEWESTLKYWRIQRGLFISFNSVKAQIEVEIASSILSNSDLLPEQCYRRINIDL
ncbi:hypothetical protein H6G17_23485 [Chroococcidiopsis sp. FACHB-1243]|nr:hypothetical protein [Chroococcidiopsis sp. [FACHB-1243]]